MASIETLITYNDDIRVIIQTKISLNDKVIATGYAEEGTRRWKLY